MICSMLTLTLCPCAKKTKNRKQQPIPLLTALCESHLQQGQISKIPLIKKVKPPM